MLYSTYIYSKNLYINCPGIYMVCTWTSWESTQVVGPNGPARGHPPRGHVPLIAAAAAGHAGGFSLLPFFWGFAVFT